MAVLLPLKESIRVRIPVESPLYPCSSTVEQEAYIFKVGGSSPPEGTKFSGSSMAEQSSDKG